MTISIMQKKINMQKPVAFLYTTNDQSEKGIRKTILITGACKNYLKINLIKEIKGFYNENYKTLKKEIK
jgi:hypothetical protein